jgi:hypothetical protein
MAYKRRYVPHVRLRVPVVVDDVEWSDHSHSRQLHVSKRIRRNVPSDNYDDNALDNKAAYDDSAFDDKAADDDKAYNNRKVNDDDKGNNEAANDDNNTSRDVR